MTQKHVNLTAYDSVEQLDSFTEESFKNYCNRKLASCSKRIGFIKEHCVDSIWKGKVCELASGSATLLYSLESAGIVKDGVGIEVSASRVRFAEKLKEYLNSRNVRSINDDIMNILPMENQDMIIGVDIALQLLTPIDHVSEEKLLGTIRQSLRPKGYLLLELWTFEHFLKQIEITNNNFRYWEEFDASDPWEFVLANITKNNIGDIVWEKRFLKRNSLEKSYFKNILRPYSHERITELLEQSGFENIRIFDKWEKEGDVDQGEYVVLAEAP